MKDKNKLKGLGPKSLNEIISVYGDPDQIEISDTDWEAVQSIVEPRIGLPPQNGTVIIFGTGGALNKGNFKDLWDDAGTGTKN
jgi:hypothetical protein